MTSLGLEFLVPCPYCGKEQLHSLFTNHETSGKLVEVCTNDECEKSFVIDWCLRCVATTSRIDKEVRGGRVTVTLSDDDDEGDL